MQAAGRLVVPDADQAADLYRLTQDVTAGHGLPAYEISNHAQPGAESRHNLTYWRYGEYIGVGPGAHGRFVEDGRRVVTIAEPMPESWLAAVEARGHGSVGGERLSRTEEADEFLLMGLRLREGIALARYEDLAGRPLPAERLAMLEAEELVAVSADGRIRATASGALVLNALVAELAREPA